MRAADVDILLVPGWTGAGPDHWMTRWEARLKTSRRVVQDDWDVVDRVKWTGRLIEEITQSEKPIILVAHSCGVPTVAHAALRIAAMKQKVIGAFLVATASETATAALPHMDSTFVPFPRDPLPFASLLVASRNDVHCSYDDAGDLALAWGSELVDAGESGHLNTESGHGPWPEGVIRLASFLQRLPAPDMR